MTDTSKFGKEVVMPIKEVAGLWPLRSLFFCPDLRRHNHIVYHLYESFMQTLQTNNPRETSLEIPRGIRHVAQRKIIPAHGVE